MEIRTQQAPKSKRGRYVAAMVLGTALSTLGQAPAQGISVPDSQSRAVTDIYRYCSACWRNAHVHPDSWTDCTQEVFCRLLERVDPDHWERVLRVEGEERREFLRAIDAVKKRSQRARKWLSDLHDGVADRRDLQERELAEKLETVRHAADDCLSPRQRRILELSLEGWSVHEIGQKLTVPVERVSDEKYKAIRKLRERIAAPVDATA